MYLRTLFGAAPYRYYLALPLLVGYGVVLVATAFPRSYLPAPIARAHRVSAVAFDHGLGYAPGVNLFGGVAVGRKLALVCVTAIGVHGASERIGFETYPGCVPPAVQFRSSSFAFGLTRVAWRLESGGQRDADRARHLEKLAGFGRYYCRSKQSPLRGADDVVFVVEVERQAYDTGARTRERRVLHVEPCAGPAPSRPYAARALPDGRISVLPEAPP